jgi:hypothetical protein
MNTAWIAGAKSALVWDGVKLGLLILGVYLIEHVMEGRTDGY